MHPWMSEHRVRVWYSWPVPRPGHTIRGYVRWIGGGLILSGAGFFISLVFLGSAWSRPWPMGLSLTVAALGMGLIIAMKDASAATLGSARRPALLLSGIFFTFGTLGPLFMIVSDEGSTPVGGLLSMAISGLLACGWASAFIFRAWWLLPAVVALQVIGPRSVFAAANWLGLLENFGGLGGQARRGIVAIEVVACLVAGYVLVIRYIRLRESEQAHAREEMITARRLHETLVPPVKTRTPGGEILGRSLASTEMGGDLVDVVRSSHRSDIILADVAGHGLGAGIVMGMLKSAARTLCLGGPSLDALMSGLNTVLFDLVREGMFATAGIVRLHDDGRVEYSLAGHLPILHYEAASNRLGEVHNTSLPLGVDPAERFAVGVIDARPGDTILMLSDGLCEVADRSGGYLGLDRIRATFAASAGMPLDALADSIFAAAATHGPRSDDQSLVLIRIRMDASTAT